MCARSDEGIRAFGRPCPPEGNSSSVSARRCLKRRAKGERERESVGRATRESESKRGRTSDSFPTRPRHSRSSTSFSHAPLHREPFRERPLAQRVRGHPRSAAGRFFPRAIPPSIILPVPFGIIPREWEREPCRGDRARCTTIPLDGTRAIQRAESCNVIAVNRIEEIPFPSKFRISLE